MMKNMLYVPNPLSGIREGRRRPLTLYPQSRDTSDIPARYPHFLKKGLLYIVIVIVFKN
jgi:hypothetical protein